MVPTRRPEEALVSDICWLTETVLVARHRSMVPLAGALPPQGISLVLAAIGSCPDAATICPAAANSVRGGGAASNRPQRLQTAGSGALSAGLLAVILCASTRAIRDAVAPSFSAPMVDGTTRLERACAHAPCVWLEERFHPNPTTTHRPCVWLEQLNNPTTANRMIPPLPISHTPKPRYRRACSS